MRLPIAKVYRAFPEFDRFTDEQCEEYVRQVRKRFRHTRRVKLAFRTSGMLLLALCLFVGSILLVAGGDRPGESFAMRHPIFGALLIATLTAVPPLGLLFWMNHRWTRKRIKEHMREIRCPQCFYFMLGLTVRDGVITCPECGDRITLALLGLTAVDVMGVEEKSGAEKIGAEDHKLTEEATKAPATSDIPSL